MMKMVETELVYTELNFYMDSENDFPDMKIHNLLLIKQYQKQWKERKFIRTLDIGGDKKLNYFEFPEEMNPFLGYRAVRFCLDRTDI